jgi:DNA-binding LacI/PurR family transcriptional regulator
MPNAKPHATLRDVAALAGVSTAAVSKFVNRKQRFTGDVEARIAQAIEQVGYRSNLAARSMVTGRSGAVAALVSGVENPHSAAVIKGISRVAMAEGYDVLFVDLLQSTAPQRELARVMGLQVDGIVLAAQLAPQHQVLTDAMLARYGRPFVTLSTAGREANGAAEHKDTGNQAAAAMLTRYLWQLGHRRITYLACAAFPDDHERLQGAQRALQSLGATLDVRALAAATPDAGAQIASSVLLDPQRPHAIICCTDLVAMGLLSEARTLGVDVPQDVSVAGLDSMPFGSYLRPPLTTVELHSDLLGEWAMQRLLASIAGADAPAPPIQLVPRLLVRGSTKAAPRAPAGS